MVAQLRSTFVVDTRSDPTAEGGTVPALVSLVDVLQLKVPATSADAAAALVTVRGSVLAALSNAGLDNTQVLHELCRAGAVATLLKLLKKPGTCWECLRCALGSRQLPEFSPRACGWWQPRLWCCWIVVRRCSRGCQATPRCSST